MMMRVLVLSVTALLASADLRVDSPAGRKLMDVARRLDDGGDYSFLQDYSVKFLGCHHVQQWNTNVDDEDDVRILTKRLVRFRLCPSDQCSNDRATGCNSKFGDYVVDMDTFLASYLEGLENDKEEICEDAATECQGYCENNDDDCVTSCYYSLDVGFCVEEENEGFDVNDYAACAQIDIANQDNGGRRLEDGGDNYYAGAFCAEQGGEIHMGLFTDDTCTTFASNGYDSFYYSMGYQMPYSQSSLVTSRCLTCGGADNGNYYTKDMCDNVYTLSGKCETRMSIGYPNESSCNYIEGIKIIREDGVIRTSTVKKSKAAAVAIGLFTTLSVLLAGYVYYLRTKLARAQINLSAASQPLT